MRDRAGGVLLALVIVGSALSFGAQHTPVLIVVAVLAAAAAILLRPSAAPRGLWLLAALAAYTLLQLVPLPVGFLYAINPSSIAVWDGAFRPFGEAPARWAPLTVDPGSTALEALKWTSYVCVLLAAGAWRSRYGANALALLLFASALAVAVVTLAHGVLEAPRIYGYWRPNGAFRWTRGPLVNANTLTGYLNLGFFAGLGVWVAQRRSKWAQLMPFGFVVLLFAIVLPGSRGGIGALVLGVLAFALVVARQRRGDVFRVGAAAAGGLALAAVVALVLGGPRLQAEVLDANLGVKATAWRWSLDIIRDFPVFGVGRGAFETAFQPYRQPLGRDWTTIFSHAENFPLEWLSDWGIPVGMVALAGTALLARRLAGQVLRDPLTAALGVGLAALFLQNFVDLGLEIFAVTAAAWVAGAAVLESTQREAARPTLLLLPAVAGVVVALVVVVATGATPIQAERERLSRGYRALVESKSRDASALLRELRAATGRHPGDAYFPLVGALVSRQVGKDDTLRWLGRSLERGPMNGNAHLLLAHVLVERGARRQAMVHARLTAVYDVTLRDYALRRASGWARTTEELVAVFPRGLPGAEMLDALCEMARVPHAVGCWREAVARHSTVTANQRLVAALVESAEQGHAPCAGDGKAGCVREAGGALAWLAKNDESNDWRTALLRARVLAVDGDLVRASAAALDGCPASPEALECIARGLDFARRARDPKSLGAIADRYLAVRCTEPSQCAKAQEEIGASYVALGAWGLALKYFSEATRVEPTTERWIQSAEAAAHVGSGVAARLALERARRSGDLSSEQRARVAATEAILEATPGLH